MVQSIVAVQNNTWKKTIGVCKPLLHFKYTWKYIIRIENVGHFSPEVLKWYTYKYIVIRTYYIYYPWEI